MQAIQPGFSPVRRDIYAPNHLPSITPPKQSPRFQGTLSDWELALASEDLCDFSNPNQDNAPSTGMSWAESAKSTVASLMGSLISLLPKQTLWHLESKNLFAGHYKEDLKTSVSEMKAAHPEMEEMLDRVEEVHFSPKNKPQHQNFGWYIPAEKGKPTILHSMGNKSSLRSILRYQPLVEDGFGLMSYEYPGYGSTKGKPEEQALYQTAEAASDFLRDEKGVPRNGQVFHGISLGGAVAANLAHTVGPAQGVILESTMTSFRDVTKNKVENYAPHWLVPLHHLTCSHMASIEKVPTIKEPLLILHGGKDELMPPDFAQKLHDAAGTPATQKKLVIFKDQPHNIDTGYSVPVIRKFLRELKETELKNTERKKSLPTE